PMQRSGLSAHRLMSARSGSWTGADQCSWTSWQSASVGQTWACSAPSEMHSGADGTSSQVAGVMGYQTSGSMVVGSLLQKVGAAGQLTIVGGGQMLPGQSISSVGSPSPSGCGVPISRSSALSSAAG